MSLRIMSITASLLAVVVSLSAAELADRQMVVEIEDRLGDSTYAVMTTSQFRAKEQESRDEAFLSSRALMKAQRVWDSKRGAFPRSVAKPIKYRCLREYREFADAQNDVTRYIKKEKDQLKKKEAKLKHKYSRVVSTKSKGRRSNKKILDTKRYQKALERNEKKQKDLEDACELYKKMLSECSTNKEASPPETASEKASD